MKPSRTLWGASFLAIVTLSSGGWLLQSPRSEADPAIVLEQVIQALSASHVNEYSRDELYQMAVEGLLEKLGDPHTAFLTPKDFEEFRISAFGDYGGIGAQIGIQDGAVTVIAALPETPAERAGLLPGDRIVAIDGRVTAGWNNEQAVAALRGPKGTPISLSITRLGSQGPAEYRLVRDEIRLRSVPYAFMLDESTGYARLSAFNETTTEELQAALADLKGEGMSRFILDLRGNPGGLLDQGAAVSDLFLPPGQEIVATRYRDPGENQTYRATTQAVGAGELPMIVLIDEYSASAAEIVAGALQDHDRALILGAPSFGKGSSQQLYRLSGGNFLKITTGLWYTPSGRSIQKTASADGGKGALSPSTAADTGKVYRSDSGRMMRGGGGIAPDRLIAPDTTTLEERAFLTQVAKGGGVFNEVLFRYAVEFGRTEKAVAVDLVVTPAMRKEFLSRLQAAGLTVDEELYAGAERIIEERLGTEIVAHRLGAPEAARRASKSDPAIQEALRLLRSSPTQHALLQEGDTITRDR